MFVFRETIGYTRTPYNMFSGQVFFHFSSLLLFLALCLRRINSFFRSDLPRHIILRFSSKIILVWRLGTNGIAEYGQIKTSRSIRALKKCVPWLIECILGVFRKWGAFDIRADFARIVTFQVADSFSNETVQLCPIIFSWIKHTMVLL